MGLTLLAQGRVEMLQPRGAGTLQWKSAMRVELITR